MDGDDEGDRVSDWGLLLLGEDEESLGRCGFTEIDASKSGILVSEIGSVWAGGESEEPSTAENSLGAQTSLGFVFMRHQRAL